MPQAQASAELSKLHRPGGADPGLEVLDQPPGAHLDTKTLETALTALLARYPDAPVLAAAPNGAIVAMPPAIALQRNPILRGRTGMELIVPSDRARLLATWEVVLSAGAAHCPVRLASDPDVTVTYYGFDLRERHGVFVAVAVPLGSGEATATDVSERSPLLPRFGRISKDDSGLIVKVDDGVTQILGWSEEEMKGHRSVEFIHPDDQPLAIDNWLEMLASPGIGRRVRLRHRRRDSSWVWFEITNNNLLEDPDYRCVVAEMVDISEEMEREQLLERLAETVPVGLFQVDCDRRIVYTNEQLHQILGTERAATVEGQIITVVEADRAALRCALDDVLIRGADAEIEVELRLPPSGLSRCCTVSMRALNHGDGSISGAIACVADVTDSTRMREELKKQATFDELTGCHNRPSIMDALEASVSSDRADARRAVMFVDLDHFKEVNDRQGHAAGDELLKVLAMRLRTAVRGGDLVGRIGGDEFLVVCPEIRDAEQAMRLARRIAQACRARVLLATDGSAHRLSVSIGVAWSHGDELGADALVARADGAMYQSKRHGAGEPSLATDPAHDRRGH